MNFGGGTQPVHSILLLAPQNPHPHTQNVFVPASTQKSPESHLSYTAEATHRGQVLSGREPVEPDRRPLPRDKQPLPKGEKGKNGG